MIWMDAFMLMFQGGAWFILLAWLSGRSTHATWRRQAQETSLPYVIGTVVVTVIAIVGPGTYFFIRFITK